MNILVCVEIPRNSPQKYEFDEGLKAVKLDRTLFSSVYFPFEYGFIKDTKSKDGDPLDAVLLATFPTFPGCYVKARPIGAIMMEDEKGIDNKIIAVPTKKVDPRFKEIETINDISSHMRMEIKNFFKSYKALEPGKWVKVKQFRAKGKAEKMIEEARKRFDTVR